MERRARKLANGVHAVSDRDIARLIDRFGGRCAYCPAPIDVSFHLDHIVPLARGGHHAIGNLAPACPGCNLSKGKLLLTEWRKRRQAQPLHPIPQGLALRGALRH
ncbi:HNH endonuclease [Microbacterium oxydans]|uniref:HNH endonuclease n=1 Tax=Microbacterium oxydans TaxID=82380 RepID=UPI00366B5E27